MSSPDQNERVRKELGELHQKNVASVGLRAPEAAASLTLAHCVLIIADELRQLRKALSKADDPAPPDANIVAPK